MEWVETTGNSIDEARAKALDLLNVDESDAEVEVIADVQLGFLKRVKSEARVRARIKPKAPAPKDDRRNRRGGGSNKSRNRSRRGGKGGGSGSGGQNREGGNTSSGNRSKSGDSGRGSGSSGSQKGGGKGGQSRGSRNDGGSGKAAAAAAAGAAAGSQRDGGGQNSDTQGRGGQNKERGGTQRQGAAVEEEFSVPDQQAVMNEFVAGVAAVFDSGASVEVVDKGEDTLEAQVSGENLGLLVGPSGATLKALEELTRTAMQRAAGGRRYHRIHVDVDQYKERRREALGRFAVSVAEQVKESGERKAMEPMSAADRKVVHDALSDMDDIETMSEGSDPRRYVVIAPAEG